MVYRAENYEASLERDERRAKGIYYTPRPIINQMLDTLFEAEDIDLSRMTICDPCCGGGNFLIAALERGFRVENIYGYDIDSAAVQITRERIAEFVEGLGESLSTEHIHIEVGDFWDIAPSKLGCFDVIASNPPWGSQLDPKRRKELCERYDAGHSVDSSSLMLHAALSTLKEDGVLTFLLPDSFFNIGGFENIRELMLGFKITQLCDYGKAFKGLMTRAQSVTLVKSRCAQDATVECIFEGAHHRRTISSFRRNPKSIINMWVSAQGAEAIDAIFAKPHLTLANAAVWGMGIVTGDNAKFICATPQRDYIEVVRGYNITKEGITQPDTYIPRDLSLYQQCAGEQFYGAREKIVYRFISSQAIFSLDCEQRYILNSANGFIPSKELPLSCEEIVKRLNSEVIVWLHKALFRSHKILRSDIERLPLHTEVVDFDEAQYLEYLNLEPCEEGGYRVKKYDIFK